jgi:hypothetical protein
MTSGFPTPHYTSETVGLNAARKFAKHYQLREFSERFEEMTS